MPITEEQLHQILASLGPTLLALLTKAHYFQQDEPPKWEALAIPVRRSISAAILSKNERAWKAVWGLYIKPGLEQGAKEIAPDVSFGPQKWINEYNKVHHMEYVKWLSQKDKDSISKYLIENAATNERPLARDLMKDSHIRYICDGKNFRLERIKRTESGRASRYGSWKAADDAGFTQKTWHATMDKRTRKEHRALNGKTIPISDEFPGEGQYPGAVSINCRCHLSYS